MPVRCDEIGPLLAGVVDGSSVLDPKSSHHVEACLRCQAELAQYRRLLRSLRQLREDPVPVPGDLASLVLARLDVPAGSPWGRRAAYAGALAATAAGAAGAIVLVASRSRRLRLAG